MNVILKMTNQSSFDRKKMVFFARKHSLCDDYLKTLRSINGIFKFLIKKINKIGIQSKAII